MRVRMNQDYSFYPDGVNLKVVKRDEVVEVRDEIGRVWVEDGRAREDKMIDAAPSVKPLSPGHTGHRFGPNVTLEVGQGTAKTPPPPPGQPAPKQDKKAKTKK